MMNIFQGLFGEKGSSELKSAIAEGAFLVDVRTPLEFSEGSVKGAVNIPLARVPESLNKFKGNKSIVVFCRTGSRSAQAKSILEQNGIKNVINGGGWRSVERLLTN